MEQFSLTRFYFNIRNDTLLEDPDGGELRDLAAARVFAIAAARDLWADAIINGHDLLHDRIEIMSEAGDCLAVIPFTDALSEAMQKRMGVRGESASSAGA